MTLQDGWYVFPYPGNVPEEDNIQYHAFSIVDGRSNWGTSRYRSGLATYDAALRWIESQRARVPVTVALFTPVRPL